MYTLNQMKVTATYRAHTVVRRFNLISLEIESVISTCRANEVLFPKYSAIRPRFCRNSDLTPI